MAGLIFVLCLCTPVGVLAYYRIYPDSALVRIIVPKFLNKEKCTRQELKQAGVGWIVFSLWLAAFSISLMEILTHQDPNGPLAILGVIVIIGPFLSFILLIAGLFYLGQGIISRKDEVTPSLRSIFTADVRQSHSYLRWLMLYTKINIAAVVLAVGIPVAEAALEIEPTGIIVLVNAASLITAIMTIWRIKAYLVKVKMVMHGSKSDALVSIFGAPPFIWYEAYVTRRKFLEYQAALDKGSTSRET